MSDVMFYGVLRMPYEMAMAGEISRLQFYNRAQEAVDRVERVEAELASARALLREQLRQDDEVLSDMQILGFVEKMPKDAVELSESIRAYLDASDKQGEKP